MDEEGLHGKYRVEKVDDSNGKHKNCTFFVLDLTHDFHARVAARAYAIACMQDNPKLSKQLFDLTTEESDRARV